MITWLITLFALTASAQTTTCKKPDFDSFKKARINQESLLKQNPVLHQPDFLIKYKLLSIEYAMETAWYLLDCETGKFIPEILYSNAKSSTAQYQQDQDLLTFGQESFRFTDGKWNRVTSSTPFPSPSPVIALLKSGSKIIECKKIDFQSYGRAKDIEKSILSDQIPLTKPNFNSHFLLLKAESLFESFWLIADCNTGKFSKTYLVGEAQFKIEDRVVKIADSGKFPKYYLWMEEDESWLEIRRPDSDPTTIKNTVFGKAAKRIFESLANPEKKDIVRFENLTWIENFIIKSGKCMSGTGSLRCDIEF